MCAIAVTTPPRKSERRDNRPSEREPLVPGLSFVDLMMFLDPDGDFLWRSFSACADGTVEFITVRKNVDIAAAKEICATCKVTDECLDYSLRTQQLRGVWGGLTAAERRSLIRSDPL